MMLILVDVLYLLFLSLAFTTTANAILFGIWSLEGAREPRKICFQMACLATVYTLVAIQLQSHMPPHLRLLVWGAM